MCVYVGRRESRAVNVGVLWRVWRKVPPAEEAVAEDLQKSDRRWAEVGGPAEVWSGIAEEKAAETVATRKRH